MQSFNRLIVGLFTWLCAPAIAQNQVELVSTNEKSVIPFHLTAYNNIVIKAVLNNKDTVNLMFHTASTSVTLTEDAFAKLKTVKLDGTVDSVRSWGGSSNSSDFSKGNSLAIGGLRWDDVTIWKDKNSGQESDGKFGIHLFANKIVELDFTKNLLTVQARLPRKVKKYSKLQLVSRNDYLFIQAICQTGKDTFSNEFLIHSGYAGAVLLDDQFVNDHKIAEQINIIGKKELKDAYGHILTTKKGILPVFRIGQQQLTNVPVGFFEGAIGQQKMSIIGGDIVKRFNWIIDAKREYIYLKPNRLFESAFQS